MDTLTYIREEIESYRAKVHRDPQLKKYRDARGSRRQNQLWMNLVPGQAVHRYSPMTGEFGLTHNGIPYWRGDGHVHYLTRAASRPRCFKKERRRNGQTSFLGHGAMSKRTQPDPVGKSSRKHMREKAYWWDVAYSLNQYPTVN